VHDQRGFTLIEVLVVILIVGILAAIAIPMFIGKKEIAEDGDAKAEARNLVSYVDSCYTQSQDFTNCKTQAAVEAEDLPWGSGPGQVSVTDANKNDYDVTAVSESGHTFKIHRSIASGAERTCTGDGGCKDGKW
jgi:type IV pilus assembly protein PilA